MVMAFDAVPGIPADMTHMMSIINKKLSNQHKDFNKKLSDQHKDFNKKLSDQHNDCLRLIGDVENQFEVWCEKLTSEMEAMSRSIDYINTVLLKVAPDVVEQVCRFVTLERSSVTKRAACTHHD